MSDFLRSLCIAENKAIAKLSKADRDVLLSSHVAGGDFSSPTCRSIHRLVRKVGELSPGLFYDLGSGTGTPVIAMAGELGIRARGIEFNKVAHKISGELLIEMGGIWNVVLGLGDILNMSGIEDPPTPGSSCVLFAFDARYPDEVLRKILDLFSKCRVPAYLISTKSPQGFGAALGDSTRDLVAAAEDLMLETDAETRREWLREKTRAKAEWEAYGPSYRMNVVDQFVLEFGSDSFAEEREGHVPIRCHNLENVTSERDLCEEEEEEEGGGLTEYVEMYIYSLDPDCGGCKDDPGKLCSNQAAHFGGCLDDPIDS